MVTKDASPTILLLKANFPEFESQIDHIYFQDEVFREIAREYHECIDKQNIITNERSGKSDFYTDTIDELKEELLTYLSGNKQQ